MARKETVGEEIKKYRKRYGYTQYDIAKMVGVARNTVLRWENEQVKITKVYKKMLVLEGII